MNRELIIGYDLNRRIDFRTEKGQDEAKPIAVSNTTGASLSRVFDEVVLVLLRSVDGVGKGGFNT